MSLRLVHRRINDAGTDRVESDARVRILDGEHSCDGVEPSLGQLGIGAGTPTTGWSASVVVIFTTWP
ncbi:MAG: hypothetical protein ACXWWI_03370, partial [Nitrospira sp.]